MKKTILILIIFTCFSFKGFSAGTEDNTSWDKPDSYYKAKKLIEKNQFNEAVVLLEETLKKSQYQKDADILTEYAFGLRKIKNFKKSEEYYLKALKINPDHKGALEYIGELYVDTKRINLAKEILIKLEKCKCEEYSELKNYINKAN